MSVQQTMPTLSATTPFEQPFLDLYKQVADALPGAKIEAVRAWREAALQAFLSLGLPHRRVEEWKYTDLRVLMKGVHPLAGQHPPVVSGVDLDQILGTALGSLDAYLAVFVNGAFDAKLSTIQLVAGVTFDTLRPHLNSDNAAHFLTGLPQVEGDVVAQLATVFATDGAVLTVAAGTTLEKPIHLIFIGAGEDPQLLATQNVLSFGKGARATILETHIDAGAGQSLSFNRIAIADEAHVTHIRLGLGGAGTHLSTAVAKLGAAAHYEPAQITLDGATSRAQATIRFEGDGGRCQYTGALLERGKSHADFTLVVDHAAVGCESRELVKAVLDDKARGVFQGKVIVRRGAQKTDGKQMANALLLSDDAEFDSKPELEIYADDVVCGHGATSGQIDEDLLFYLRARGLPLGEARALLIAAFVGEALEKIEDEALRGAVLDKVDAWLANPSRWQENSPSASQR